MDSNAQAQAFFSKAAEVGLYFTGAFTYFSLMRTKEKPSLLLFEPENKGHHLQYLGYLATDFLAAGFEASLAFDQRDATARDRLNAHNPALLAETDGLAAHTDANGAPRPKNTLRAAAQCLEESGADELFMCCLDEVSSDMLRRAAVGLLPPARLRGRISGIFIRPRPLDPDEPASMNQALKRAGINKLIAGGWFKRLFLLDEFLCADLQKEHPGLFYFLPDVAEAPPTPPDRDAARAGLQLPADKTILLHFGTGTRRKGLPLVLQALQDTPTPDAFHLVVAGKQDEPNDELDAWAAAHRATVLNRFVTEEESQQVFAAADWILLPYIDHYGASNVLARAAWADRPVIASDYHLLGRRVKTYDLGLTFQNNNAADLAARLASLDRDVHSYSEGLKRYAHAFRRAAFTESLLAAYA